MDKIARVSRHFASERRFRGGRRPAGHGAGFHVDGACALLAAQVLRHRAARKARPRVEREGLFIGRVGIGPDGPARGSEEGKKKRRAVKARRGMVMGVGALDLPGEENPSQS